MIDKIRSFIELARLDKPIGIYLLLWPSLLGYVLAGINSELKVKTLIVVIGSIIVRSCGCVINDISDYKIDKLVKRTLNRPLALVQSPNRSMDIFSFAGYFVACTSFQTNPLTIKIAIFCFFNNVIPAYKKILCCPTVHSWNHVGSGSIIAYSLESNIFLSPAILYLE